jgi:hypothetical protein
VERKTLSGDSLLAPPSSTVIAERVKAGNANWTHIFPTPSSKASSGKVGESVPVSAMVLALAYQKVAHCACDLRSYIYINIVTSAWDSALREQTRIQALRVSR